MLCTLTDNDEEGLQHVNQELEAKVVAPFFSERFGVSLLVISLTGLFSIPHCGLTSKWSIIWAPCHL